MKNKNKHN